MDCLTNSNTNFTSRCAQIRDAKWVCKKVHSYTHVSPFKINRTVERLSEPYINSSVTNATISARTYRLFGLLDWKNNLIDKINSLRKLKNTGYNNDYKRTNDIISQLKENKLGNCWEDAFVACAILKMNGVKDACTAELSTKGHIINHSVCVFNKDGSVFNGQTNKNTVIVDPWVGDADFASNMFVKYKGLYNQLVDKSIQSDSKIEFWNVKHTNLSKEELLALEKEHPELKFNNPKRTFMQNK